jgi:hypothetical protein
MSRASLLSKSAIQLLRSGQATDMVFEVVTAQGLYLVWSAVLQKILYLGKYGNCVVSWATYLHLFYLWSFYLFVLNILIFSTSDILLILWFTCFSVFIF